MLPLFGPFNATALPNGSRTKATFSGAAALKLAPISVELLPLTTMSCVIDGPKLTVTVPFSSNLVLTRVRSDNFNSSWSRWSISPAGWASAVRCLFSWKLIKASCFVSELT